MRALKGPLPVQAVLKEMESYFGDYIVGDVLNPRREVREDRLRVSGFPYCGLRHAYKRLRADDSEKIVKFDMLFYTATGTVAHENIQYALGHGMRILGNWKCLNPGCKGRRKLQKKNDCPVCQDAMGYEELTVKYGRHVSGHLDGVYQSRDGRYWLIDYKTSSVRAIRRYFDKMPYKSNVAQIKAYCALIELMFDIKISGWILMYVSRDSPRMTYKAFGKEISTSEKALILKKIRSYGRAYDHVMFCESYNDIQYLIDNKPCKTRDFYDEEYGGGFKECELAKGGTCFAPKRLDATMQEAWEQRAPKWKEVNRPGYLKGMKRATR